MPTQNDLTIFQVSEILNCSPTSVKRLITCGYLNAYTINPSNSRHKDWRVEIADLVRFKEARKHQVERLPSGQPRSHLKKTELPAPKTGVGSTFLAGLRR
jgi:hypothetical protein